MGLLKKWKRAREVQSDDADAIIVIDRDDYKKKHVVWWVALKRMGK